jgi:hypothetical protein
VATPRRNWGSGELEAISEFLQKVTPRSFAGSFGGFGWRAKKAGDPRLSECETA